MDYQLRNDGRGGHVIQGSSTRPERESGKRSEWRYDEENAGLDRHPERSICDGAGRSIRLPERFRQMRAKQLLPGKIGSGTLGLREACPGAACAWNERSG